MTQFAAIVTEPARAFFSKRVEARTGQIAAIAAAAPGPVIHLHPKNTTPSAAPRNGQRPFSREGVVSAAYEDLEDGTTWLGLNARAGSNATLILEKASRYPRVGGQKFKRIQTLSKRVGAVFVVDIVPFCLEPRFLYTTFSYLGTDILGISKYAAMHEEYEELMPDGRVVRVGSDPVELARRIAPVSAIDYASFTAPRETVRVECSFEELERYEAAKEALFAEDREPATIVTKLADLAHAFPTRANALLGLLKGIQEPAVVYVNLTSYAARINRALKAAGLTRHRAVSYQVGCEEPTPVAVYMEAPIVNSHFFLDAESRILPGGRAYHVQSDAKVDAYLSGKLTAELVAIDALAGEMSSCATI